MTTSIDKPEPLSRYVRGIAHLSLPSGAQVEIPMSRETAEHLRRKVAGQEGSDDLAWYETGFIQVERPELFRFTPDPELGWPLQAQERQRQSENGYHAGIVDALVELHRDLGGPEPEFSARAIWCMHHFLTEGIEPEKLAETAAMLAGEKGASLAAAAYRTAAASSADSARAHRAKPGADDEAEPEPAPTTTASDEPDKATESDSETGVAGASETPPDDSSTSADADPLDGQE